MNRGLYTAASGMVNQLMVQDIMANNMANVNTVGFKRTGTSLQGFSDLMLSKQSTAGSTPVGHILGANRINRSTVDWSPGSVQQTGNPLDIALQGEGFLTVTTTEGKVGYTRNGSLNLSADGYLVTQNGYQIMGENGPIQLPANTGNIQIDKKGQISAGGQPVSQLKLVTFEDLKTLKPEGYNFFTTDQPAKVATGTTLIQGAIERPNVNVISEMLQNMTGVRVYETLQKTLQAHSDLLKKAVTEVGRVR